MGANWIKGFIMADLLLQLFQLGQTVLFCIFGLIIWFAVKCSYATPSNKAKSIF